MLGRTLGSDTLSRQNVPRASHSRMYKIIRHCTARGCTAAIYNVLRARNVTREIGAQEQDDVCHLLGSAVAADRNVGLIAGPDTTWISRI